MTTPQHDATAGLIDALEDELFDGSFLPRWNGPATRRLIDIARGLEGEVRRRDMQWEASQKTAEAFESVEKYITELEDTLRPFAECVTPDGSAWAFVKRGRLPLQLFADAARVLAKGRA